MKTGVETKSIQERSSHLLRLFSSARFLKKEGIGNEVPFFICPFPSYELVEMQKIQKQLVNQLSYSGITVLEVNLYDMALEILKEREILEIVFEKELEYHKDELLELLQNVLDPEQELVPLISKKMAGKEHQILFITGVGEVYPYIRSHNVLNNLQSVAKEGPTVMFFPGAYTQCSFSGSSLELFGRLKDDKYYRAFNVYHCDA